MSFFGSKGSLFLSAPNISIALVQFLSAKSDFSANCNPFGELKSNLLLSSRFGEGLCKCLNVSLEPVICFFQSFWSFQFKSWRKEVKERGTSTSFISCPPKQKSCQPFKASWSSVALVPFLKSSCFVSAEIFSGSPTGSFSISSRFSETDCGRLVLCGPGTFLERQLFCRCGYILGFTNR